MEKTNSALMVRKDEKPNFKEKLKNWYVNNIANNGNTIKKLYGVRTTVQNTAGAIALGIFCPELLPVVPAIQKGNKKLNDIKYDLGRSAIHKGLDIKDDEINEKPASHALDSLTDEAVSEVTKNVADKVIEKMGEGRSR